MTSVILPLLSNPLLFGCLDFGVGFRIFYVITEQARFEQVFDGETNIDGANVSDRTDARNMCACIELLAMNGTLTVGWRTKSCATDSYQPNPITCTRTLRTHTQTHSCSLTLTRGAASSLEYQIDWRTLGYCSSVSVAPYVPNQTSIARHRPAFVPFTPPKHIHSHSGQTRAYHTIKAPCRDTVRIQSEFAYNRSVH